MRLIGYLLINSLAVLITARIVPGVVIDSIVTALVVSVVMGIVNTLVRPVLLLLTLPINLLSLGLFTFIINALLVLLVDFLVAGFDVSGFTSALFFSLAVSIVGWFLGLFSRGR